MQIGKKRGEHGIFGISGADVNGQPLHSFRPRVGVSEESLDSVDLLRVAGLSEVACAGKYAERAGQWQTKLLDLDRDLRSEYCSRGRTVNGNILWFDGLDQFFVNRHYIFHRGREGVFGSQAIENRHDSGLRQVGDGNGFGE